MTRKLGLRKKPSGWWITGLPVYYADGEGPFTECGPYDKQEAQETRQGLEITLDKMGWEDEEPPQGQKAKPGTSSGRVVPTISGLDKKIVQANKSLKPVVKEVIKRKAVAVKEQGFW